VGQVEKIKASTVDAETLHITTRPGTVLSQFQTITALDALKLLTKSPTKHCGLDPAPTWLIKRTANVLAPVIAAVCNASLEAGILPTSQKQAVVTARLKKPSLNPDDLNSYRPISNLSFLSKLIERAVASQFMAHSDSNHLLPPRQSAYRRRFSTETAVLLVYNDIIRAVDQGYWSPWLFLTWVVPLIWSITSHYFPSSAKGSQLLIRRLLGFSRTWPTNIKFSPPTLPNQHLLPLVLAFHRVPAYDVPNSLLIQRILPVFSHLTISSITCSQMTLSHTVTAQFPTFQTSSCVFRNALRILLDPTHHIASSEISPSLISFGSGPAPHSPKYHLKSIH